MKNFLEFRSFLTIFAACLPGIIYSFSYFTSAAYRSTVGCEIERNGTAIGRCHSYTFLHIPHLSTSMFKLKKTVFALALAGLMAFASIYDAHALTVKVSAFGHKKGRGTKAHCDTWCCFCLVIHIESDGIIGGFPSESTYPADIMAATSYNASLNSVLFNDAPTTVAGYLGVYKLDDGQGPVLYYMETPGVHTAHNDGTNNELLRLVRNVIATQILP